MTNLKIYADVLEEAALDQFEQAMAMPFVVDGALMPDAHYGYDLPIGAVVATDAVVCPAWVGYDIGCGMTAMELDLRPDDFDVAAAKAAIEAVVPTGFNVHHKPADRIAAPATETPGAKIWQRKRQRYETQLGTLGSGNHFLEVGTGENGNVWIVVHSGSRGYGHAVATHYITHCNKFLEVGSPDELDYRKDLEFCLQYALRSRELMCQLAAGALSDPQVLQFVNRNHNHAELKDGLWIHRKGATHAEEGMMGVIPGNMRDGSFIVQGKGNQDWLNSSSHGAGRVLSRRNARKSLDVDDFAQAMDGICANVSEHTLDESPMAYKNIFDVMELQKDSVEVVDYIKPLLNIKG